MFINVRESFTEQINLLQTVSSFERLIRGIIYYFKELLKYAIILHINNKKLKNTPK